MDVSEDKRVEDATVKATLRLDFLDGSQVEAAIDLPVCTVIQLQLFAQALVPQQRHVTRTGGAAAPRNEADLYLRCAQAGLDAWMNEYLKQRQRVMRADAQRMFGRE